MTFRSERSAANFGINALVAFLEAARPESEPKARRHLAKMLWLLKTLPLSGPNVETAMDDALVKYALLIPAYNWLPWYRFLCALLKLTNYRT